MKMQRTPDFRACSVERFEERILKASDLFEFVQPAVKHVGNLHSPVPGMVSHETSHLDVNGDNVISTHDAEAVITFLVSLHQANMDRQGDSLGEAEPGSDDAWQDSTSGSVDVNNDGETSPLDVLLVVIELTFITHLRPAPRRLALAVHSPTVARQQFTGQIQNQELLSGKVNSEVLVQGEFFGSAFTTPLRLPSDVFDSSFQNELEESAAP